MADPLISSYRAARQAQLVLPVTDSDILADLDEKIEAASDLVRNRIADSLTDSDAIAVVDAWTEETVPTDVRAAVLVQFMELWRFRGDDERTPITDGHSLSPAVERLLKHWTVPTLA